MAKRKPRELICTTHGYIDEILDELLEIDITATAVKDLRELQRSIKKQLKEAKRYVAEAADAGQAMENRLSEYRYAIEELGFEKVENG